MSIRGEVVERMLNNSALCASVRRRLLGGEQQLGVSGIVERAAWLLKDPITGDEADVIVMTIFEQLHEVTWTE